LHNHRIFRTTEDPKLYEALQVVVVIERFARLLPFVVQYLTTNGNPILYGWKSPLSLSVSKGVKRAFAEGTNIREVK